MWDFIIPTSYNFQGNDFGCTVMTHPKVGIVGYLHFDSESMDDDSPWFWAPTTSADSVFEGKRKTMDKRSRFLGYFMARPGLAAAWTARLV